MNDEYRINSVDEYIKAVFQKTINFKSGPKHEIFWFRGESSIEFKTPLVPNAYRGLANTFQNIIDDLYKSDHIKQIERNISAEFYRTALQYIISRGIENTEWNRYFLMQHYHIYTRLLDWTENALSALFFAINDNFSTDAIVWILQPFNLNSYTIKTILGSKKDCCVIPPAIDSEKPQKLINRNKEIRMAELTRRYLKMDFDRKDVDESTDIYFPLAIFPSYLDERMSSQKACFTIFGDKINGLLSMINCEEKILDSILIAGESKRKLINELRILGIDYDTIYPDLDGLGKSIIEKYKSEFADNRETLSHLLKCLSEKQNKTE